MDPHRLCIQLLEKLLDKERLDLDADALRRLKQLCKQHGEPAVRLVFDAWLDRLKENSARVRYLAVDLADELFGRSSAFRSLVAANFTEILELTLGFKPGMPLPPPAHDAAQLRQRALECVERWMENYGSVYPQITMGHTYLKKVVKMRFPELRARAAAREAEAAARQERTRQINEERYAVIMQRYKSKVVEVEKILDEMEATMRLLEERPDPLPAPGDDDDWEDIHENGDDGQTDVQTQGRPAVSAPVDLSKADPAVVDSLRGSYKLLTNRCLDTVLEWLKVAVKVDVGQPGSLEHARRETLLRTAIRLRDRILDAKTHCETLMQGSSNGAAPSTSGDPSGGSRLVIDASVRSEAEDEQQLVTARVTSGNTASTSGRRNGSRPGPSKPKATEAEAGLLTDVFGSESDEDADTPPGPVRSPANRRNRSRLETRQPQASPPQHFDPTYREQSAGQRALLSKEALPETAIALPQAIPPPQAKASAKSGAQTALPEDLKQKLLSGAPTIPAGNHLAYWDSDKASLLNNKGMEVYNHWGAVDEHVALPEHVISQFFTTRASYYEPPKNPGAKDSAQQQAAPPPPPQKRKDAPEEADDQPPRKKPAPVTAIGTGGVTNSSSLSRMLQPVHSMRAARLAKKPPAIMLREPETSAEPPPPQQQQPTRAPPPEATRPPAQQPQDGPRAAANAAGSAPLSRNAPKDKAEASVRQRALDRAHNEAVLGASGDDEAFARSLAEHEAQALQPKASKSKRKEPPSVRERLTRKLLSGHATAKAIHDLDSVEDEHFKERESRRW